MSMDIHTFCSLYGVSKSTAYRKIGKYRDTVLKGHITKEGKKTEQLDDFAVEFLSPKVTPGQGIEDVLTRIEKIETESKKNYDELTASIARLSKILGANKALFDDYRRTNNEKIEQAVIKSAMTEERVAAVEKNLSGCQEQMRKLSEKITATDERPKPPYPTRRTSGSQ
ncbi:hypothetical protein [Ruminococcus sp.]|uniref:hypothetical protein n=1 Tax=Ruminococcus sp. TaxID=41978 RepID=UPI0025F637D8|nr:hypothetical protein [Ruminococcus sp.]MBR1433337.1 hypothetical protein [Ruminococcus sp.]